MTWNYNGLLIEELMRQTDAITAESVTAVPCRDKRCPYSGEHNLDDHLLMDRIAREEEANSYRS